MKSSLPVFRYTRSILAYMVVTFTFAFLFCICFLPIPKENKDIVNTAQGFAWGLLGVVIGYFFGTSKDKSDQDQSKIFPKEPPNP